MDTQLSDAEEYKSKKRSFFKAFKEDIEVGDYFSMGSLEERDNGIIKKPQQAEVTELLARRLEKIPHFLMVIGQDTKILFANDIARKTLRVGSLEGLVGKSILQFTSQNLDKYITRCFREKLSGVSLYVENAFPRAQSELDNLHIYYENFNGSRLLLIVSFKEKEN